jgi:CBS domain-containing protein
MEDLLQMARKPAVSTHPTATAQEVAELLVREKVGAAVVLEDGRLRGIVSERDIVGRVVALRRDPETTLVSEFMTAEVRTVHAGVKLDEAIDLMHAGNFRHLPVVDADGAVLGMMSIRHLLRRRVFDLDVKTSDLLTYISADGAGG